jgi:hypothetical protein
MLAIDGIDNSEPVKYYQQIIINWGGFYIAGSEVPYTN